MKILAYHHLSEGEGALFVGPFNFEKQIEFILKRNSIISLEKLISEEKGTSITFDDGYEENYLIAYPILKKYNLTATIFLTTDYVEKRDYLTWKEIKEMANNGFSFGSHTISHPHLTEIPLKEAKREIVDSKEVIEDKIGRAVKFFCYPFGEFNDEIKELVNGAEYQGAVVTPKSGGIKETAFTLKRIGIYAHTSIFQLRIKLLGIIRWLR